MSVEVASLVFAVAKIGAAAGAFTYNSGGFRSITKTGTGQFSLRLTEPINFLRGGAGAVFPVMMTAGGFAPPPSQFAVLVTYDPADGTVVDVHTQVGGNDADIDVGLLVLRFPQVAADVATL